MNGQKTTLGAVITLIGSIIGVLGYTLDPNYIYLVSVISIAIVGVGASIIGYFAPDAQKKIIDGLTFAEKLNQVAKLSPNQTVRDVGESADILEKKLIELLKETKQTLDKYKAVKNADETTKTQQQ